tara:strand:+ start:305 stop:985 length:681 start_codon:yes stop_codon:yes gene_type:complete
METPIFAPKLNFFCISNHNNCLSWIDDYLNDYIVYDRSDSDDYCEGLNYKKSPNMGYNIYDILTFIIENYDNLPEHTTFLKGNIFPRHINKRKFEQLKDSKTFTPLFDPSLHAPEFPTSMFSSDGLWSEINNSWYMTNTKYFKNYNDFLKFCFIDSIEPLYITFAPGANYAVPRENILKYDKIFYKNLKTFVSWDTFCSEAHMIERFLYSFWLSNFEVNSGMKKLL